MQELADELYRRPELLSDNIIPNDYFDMSKVEYDFDMSKVEYDTDLFNFENIDMKIDSSIFDFLKFRGENE